MRTYGLTALCIIFGYSTPAYAGPFGTEMGVRPDALGFSLDEETNGWFKTDIAPIPNSIFDSYLFKFSDEGLCEIRATGLLKIEDKLTGGLKYQTMHIIGLLEGKYGEKRELNTYNNHLRIEAPDMMWEFRGNDKSYWASWASKGEERLLDNLMNISLSTNAKSAVSGNVTLNYQFMNYSSCDAVANAQGL